MSQSGHDMPAWFVEPGAFDSYAIVSLVVILAAIYGIFYLYAKFDHWAEEKSKATPLAKTIPTLLTIALLYEVFPLDHFSVLLPLAAIMIAGAADWVAYQNKQKAHAGNLSKADTDMTEKGEPADV